MLDEAQPALVAYVELHCTQIVGLLDLLYEHNALTCDIIRSVRIRIFGHGRIGLPAVEESAVGIGDGRDDIVYVGTRFAVSHLHGQFQYPQHIREKFFVVLCDYCIFQIAVNVYAVFGEE